MSLCDYGCNQESNYKFDNGKNCCSSHWLKCPTQNKKLKGKNNPFYGKIHSSESKEKMSEKNKGNAAWNKGIPRTEKEKNKISIKTKEAMSKPDVRKKLKENRPNFEKEKHPNWKGGYYNKKIPLYDTYSHRIVYAEKCRRSKTDRNILEVVCVYCDSWFVPTVTQIYERLRTLDGKNFGEQRLYCSQKCKDACPIFHQINYEKGAKPSTSREVQPELRKMRFKIDNYSCQKCKKHKNELDVPLHCHHVEGIRWDPIESADIDKCITVCESCHVKIHKIDGCGYHEMKCDP